MLKYKIYQWISKTTKKLAWYYSSTWYYDSDSNSIVMINDSTITIIVLVLVLILAS